MSPSSQGRGGRLFQASLQSDAGGVFADGHAFRQRRHPAAQRGCRQALGGSHGPVRVSPIQAGVAFRSTAPWEQREFIYRTERLNHSVFC